MIYLLKYDGIPCSCHEVEYKGINKDRCVLCDRDIKKKEKVILLVSNYRLFPSCMIHKDCLKPEDKVDVKLLGILRNDYRDVKRNYEDAKEEARKWGLVE